MSRAKRNEYDNLTYRFELLEKRFDSLERLIHSGRPDGGITQELLQFMMSMMKQQQIPMHQPIQQQQHNPVQSGETSQSQQCEEKPDAQLDKSKVGFYRRVGIM